MRTLILPKTWYQGIDGGVYPGDIWVTLSLNDDGSVTWVCEKNKDEVVAIPGSKEEKSDKED